MGRWSRRGYPAQLIDPELPNSETHHEPQLPAGTQSNRIVPASLGHHPTKLSRVDSRAPFSRSGLRRTSTSSGVTSGSSFGKKKKVFLSGSKFLLNHASVQGARGLMPRHLSA